MRVRPDHGVVAARFHRLRTGRAQPRHAQHASGNVLPANVSEALSLSDEGRVIVTAIRFAWKPIGFTSKIAGSAFYFLFFIFFLTIGKDECGR